MLLECHRGVAFCCDPTFEGVGTGHMVPAVNAFASDTTGKVGVAVEYCRFFALVGKWITSIDGA